MKNYPPCKTLNNNITETHQVLALWKEASEKVNFDKKSADDDKSKKNTQHAKSNNKRKATHQVLALWKV